MFEKISFGGFIPPLHRPGRDIASYFHQDMKLLELMDDLGFDEAWVGEHHTGGWGTIACPEMFLSAAFERTKHIRLGTGVVSLPYHHPFLVANRAVQLSIMSSGRSMLGVGAGSFPADAFVLGIEPGDLRRRTSESIEAILALLNGEVVSMSTDWFTINEGQLQILPAEKPVVAISSAASPASMQLAGKHGIAPLSFGSPRPGGTLPNLGRQWGYAEDEAKRWGGQARRSDWRIVLNVVVGKTDGSARDAAREGCMHWVREYYGKALGLPVDSLPVEPGHEVDFLADSGAALVGSPETVAEQLSALHQAAGGFGHVLVTVNDWMSPEATSRSLELIATDLRPRFTGRDDPASSSMAWAASKVRELAPGAITALQNAYSQAGVIPSEISIDKGSRRD